MALTQISTAGVKDDAVTSGKIPANAVGSSELANNAVDTAAIADDAVTAAKLADGTITSTQIAANTIGTGVIADQAITLAKLAHGTSSNNGKFLRANNGADPTFETVNTDLVSDTSPQLGGELRSNGNDIHMADNDKIRVGGSAGASTDGFEIYHDGSASYIEESGTGNLRIKATNLRLANSSNQLYAFFTHNAGAEFYYTGNKKLETTNTGVDVTGNATISGAINLSDNQNINVGGGGDLKIFHDGSHSKISNSTGYLVQRSNQYKLSNLSEDHTYIKIPTHEGGVELYYDNSKKVETVTNGVKVIGAADAGGGATSGNIQMVATSGRKNTIGNHFDTGSYDSRIEFGVSDGSTSGGTNRVASISYAGISFGTDTASANRLDDYEEGSWTPVVLDQNGSNYSISVATNDTYYTKIGRLVTLMFNISNAESGSKTGYLYIPSSAFPFTPAKGAQNGSFWVDHSSPTAGLGDIVGGIMNVGTSGAWFTKPTDESGMGYASSRYLEHGQWSYGRPIYGHFQFITS